MNQSIIKRLAETDAFGSLELDRRTAIWQALAKRENAPLFAELDDDEPPVELPPMSPLEQVFADYRMSGFSLKNHPMAFFRHELDQQRILRAAELKTIDDGSASASPAL